MHRVVITSILLAAKFFDDAYYNNAYYAKVGGVLVSEMNGLEVDFLFRINFSLRVDPAEFEQYRAELLAHSFQETPTPTTTTLLPPPVHVSPEVHSSPAPMLDVYPMYTEAAMMGCCGDDTTFFDQRPRLAGMSSAGL